MLFGKNFCLGAKRADAHFAGHVPNLRVEAATLGGFLARPHSYVRVSPALRIYLFRRLETKMYEYLRTTISRYANARPLKKDLRMFVLSSKGNEFVWQWLLSTLAVLFFLSGDLASAANPKAHTLQTKLEQAKKQLALGNTPYETSRIYDKLFDKLSSHHLPNLQRDSNLAIALRSSWHQVINVLPKDQQDKEIALEKPKLKRFMTFLKRSVGINIPKWWEKLVLGARAYNRKTVFFPPLTKRFYHNTVAKIQAPLDHGLLNVDAKTFLVYCDRKIQIPPSITKTFDRLPGPCVSACLAAKKMYFAVHEDRCSPYHLYSIDQHSGKNDWKTDVWASGGLIIWA